MNDTERLLELIDCLDIEDLKLLRHKIEEILNKNVHKVSNYLPSNDSEVIASYARRFHYSEERREEVLKKLKK